MICHEMFQKQVPKRGVKQIEIWVNFTFSKYFQSQQKIENSVNFLID